MRQSRFQACAVSFAVCAAMLAQAAFAAEKYPERPVRMIIPFAAGGATDVQTRLTSAKLAERMGQQFVIDNRPGQGGALGTAVAAKAEPDGYTILQTATPFVVSPHVYSKLSYDPLKDFVPVTQFGSAPNLLVVHPSLPAKSVKRLIALAKSQPGKLDWASSGTGGGQHLFGELFMSMAGIKITHISYKGIGAAAADLLGGQVKIGLAVLKPGGVIGVVQHEARADVPDAWAGGASGCLKRDFVIGRFEQAGFEFLGASETNQNAKDQPGGNDVVWRLPPTLGTSGEDPELRAQLEAVGESNRMTLKFRKPEQP